MFEIYEEVNVRLWDHTNKIKLRVNLIYKYCMKSHMMMIDWVNISIASSLLKLIKIDHDNKMIEKFLFSIEYHSDVSTIHW